MTSFTYLTVVASAHVAMFCTCFLKSEAEVKFRDHLLTVVTFRSGKNRVCQDVNEQVNERTCVCTRGCSARFRNARVFSLRRITRTTHCCL